MNHEITNSETDLLCYRLRTARQKKRMQYKSLEKKLRALDRERDELWMKRRNLGWIELNPPVMRGWKRFFVLRDDVAQSVHAVFFKNILDKINTTAFSNRKDFKVKKKRLRKWKYETKKQKLLEPYAREFSKMNFSDKEKLFFEERIVLDDRRQWVKKFVFIDPWRFVLKVRPNMINRTRSRNEEMESRLAELENYFHRNYFEPVLSKFKGRTYNYKEYYPQPKAKDKYVFNNMSLSQILHAVQEQNTEL